MAEPAYMFQAEIEAIHEGLMFLGNCEFVPEEDDPRNLDPDDSPLEELSAAASSIEEAVHDLQLALRNERRKRMDVLDNMQPEEFVAWEAKIAELDAKAYG